MPARISYDDDADLSIVTGRRVAVIGYGSQGSAQALCLRDSGATVRVGLPDSSPGRIQAAEQGLPVGPPAEVAAWADVIVLLVPDTAQPAVYATDIAPHLSRGDALVVGQGFSIRYGLITPPSDVDVVLMAPKGPGDLVRDQYVDGKGVPALVAVHQDASGVAWPLALSYAKAIGATRAGAIAASLPDAVEAGLFGAQVVRCGGVPALVRAGFEVLTAAGYPPEVAYLECLHELKQTVDLLYEGGAAGLPGLVDEVAEYGGRSRGSRIVDERVTQEMRQILAEIRSGQFAREWGEDAASGRPKLAAWREQAANHPIEAAGARVRSLMSWIDHPAVQSARVR